MYIVILIMSLKYDPIMDWNVDEEPPIPLSEIELECSRRLLLSNDERLFYPRGMARYYQRKFNVAFQDLEKAAKSTPRNAKVQFRFGMAAYRLSGRRELVLQAADNLARLDGGAPYGQALKGLLNAKKDEDASLPILLEANAEIGSIEMSMLIGALLFRQKKYDESLKHFSLALVAPNTDPFQALQCHAWIGMAHFANRDFERGVSHFIIVNEHSPSTVMSFVLLWDYWLLIEQYEIASKLARERYSRLPNDKVSKLHMALVLAYERDFEAALKLARASDEEIVDTDWRGRLARVFWEAAKYEEAIECLQPLIDSGRLRARDELLLSVHYLTCPDMRIRNSKKGLAHITHARKEIDAYPSLSTELGHHSTVVLAFAHAANSNFDKAQKVLDDIETLASWPAPLRRKIGLLADDISNQAIPSEELVSLSIFDLWGTIDYSFGLELDGLK